MTGKVKRLQDNNTQAPLAKIKKYDSEVLDANSKKVRWAQNSKQNSKPNYKKKEFSKTAANISDPPGEQDWNEFKKQKKELKLKRKKAKDLYEITVEAKQLAESLRRKDLKGGKNEREQLVLKLHGLLSGHYSKVVLSHDVARIVQFLLKFAPEKIRKEVAKELVNMSAEMLQSKYARYCLKSLLKYGNAEIRSDAINAMYGSAVKLSSHVVSAAIFEYAYSTFASPLQKQNLVQEFFGDMYKQSKDPEIKHLRDVYKNSTSMKMAALSSTKANLSRVLNKDLLDSGLIQSVLNQFLSECTEGDRSEMISQLAPHVVIVSNSKDGVRVAMKCIWQGNNKDKKIIMKAIKEHVIELSKHEYGHATIIALLDSVDDTVLLNKIIISQLVENVQDLVMNEWGRKVVLWLLAPAESTHFHPIFIAELKSGYEGSTSKKSPSIRRSEILSYTRSNLLKLVISDASFWLSTSSIAVITLAIFKSGCTDETLEALEAISKVVIDSNWKIKDEEKEVSAIEHSGLHMILKKLIQLDKLLDLSFGKIILNSLLPETLKSWLKLNRGCFLLVAIFENSKEEVQKEMIVLMQKHLNLLKEQTSSGARILLKKLSC